MSRSDWKEVRFDNWCSKCLHWKKPQGEEPCDSCLEHGMREGTEKPENFEERK